MAAIAGEGESAHGRVCLRGRDDGQARRGTSSWVPCSSSEGLCDGIKEACRSNASVLTVNEGPAETRPNADRCRHTWLLRVRVVLVEAGYACISMSSLWAWKIHRTAGNPGICCNPGRWICGHSQACQLWCRQQCGTGSAATPSFAGCIFCNPG